jgi:hypothetical protein
LALDYLLASEGGVCGKFNLSNSCLQIDDEGKAIEEITDRMRKLTQVPVQTWRGWDPNDLFECWLFCLRWIQNPDRGNGPDPRSMLNTALPGSPRAMVYQYYYGGHYRKKNGYTCNDALEM